ncbi:hypothetical protein JDY09_03340 [Thermoleophilum album]|jgi:hypothetical protein|uniref:hypothetical protein n=1 Tax=Thermoleophilum album TaxID=29539 RepID=UPI000CC7CC97|nr:hypothetical protein [Thermoleophilum album]MCL6440598.1 hypothetical protein [Thermoleophilum sp.]WDT94301.1 hypothetical protein JDY09_03340 [Thermoleophilum album]GBD45773.1 hypothetical protein HRbin41_00589 [bacterium HR41]
MSLVEQFERIVTALPDDWSYLELDLELRRPQQFVEAATLLTQVNAIPDTRDGLRFTIRVAHRFGHAAAVPAVRATLRLLDEQGIDAALALRDVRAGRAEVVPMWGRPESVRREFQRLRMQ